MQLLDGVGAGIFGAITPLVLADLMRGTGRYNIAQGVVATVQGIGASSSGLVAGLIVDYFGYTAAFGEAAVVAAIALAVLVILMPETATPEPGTPSTEDQTCRELWTRVCPTAPRCPMHEESGRAIGLGRSGPAASGQK